MLAINGKSNPPLTHTQILLSLQLIRQDILLIFVECRKSIVIYSRSKLTERQATYMAMQVSTVDKTYGSYISAPDYNLHVKFHVRLGLSCKSPIDIPYYSS